MKFKKGDCVIHVSSSQQMKVKEVVNDPDRESIFKPGGSETGPEKKVYLCTWADANGIEREGHFAEDELLQCNA